MGCAICLDGFFQDSSDDQRPAALSCGHLYHLSCLEQWYITSARSRKNNDHSCALCKTTTPLDRIVKLYPQESRDLDTYLAHQHVEIDPRILQPTEPPAEGHDQVETLRRQTTINDHQAAEKLLGSLLDLRQHMQHWVMAVHGVRVEAVTRSGCHIKKLIADLTDAQTLTRSGQQDLDASFTALEAAVKQLDEQRAAYLSAETSLKESEKRLRAKERLIRQQKHQAAERLAAADTRDADLQKERQSLEAVILKAFEETKAQHAREAELDVRSDALEAERREIEALRRRDKLETAQKLRAMEQTLQEKSKEADEAVARSAEREREASRERDATVHKNNHLADQLRFLQNEVKKARMKLEKKSEEAREVEALKRKLAEVQHKLKLKRIRNVAASASASASQMAPSSSPSSSTCGRGELRGDAHLSSPCPASHVMASPSGSSSVLKAKQQQQQQQQQQTQHGDRLTLPASTLLIEGEDLDDELFQDNLYPMPGFAAARPSSTLERRWPLGMTSGLTSAAQSKARPGIKSNSRKAGAARRALAAVAAPIQHQGTIRFHRRSSGSDVAVKLAPIAGEEAAGGKVIDLCTSSPSEEGGGGGGGGEGERREAAMPRRGEVGSRRRMEMPSLDAWIEKRNGVVLGPKRKRR